GVANAGSPKYYQADDAVALEAALDEIGGKVAGDPEFGGCPGTPCPDGRCFGAGETCTMGFCVSPISGDGGVGGGDGGNGNGDGGNGHGNNGESSGGCGCHVGDHGSAAPGQSPRSRGA